MDQLDSMSFEYRASVDTWVGHLRNSPSDIVIDVLLLLAIIYSYVPQIIRLQQRNSSAGLSRGFVMFHALYSTSQLSNALMVTGFGWPSPRDPLLSVLGDCRSGRPDRDFCDRDRLYGWKAFGGLLGLLQITAQWACAMVLVLSLVRRLPTIWSRILNSIPPVLHIVFILLPAMDSTLPRPEPATNGLEELVMWAIITVITCLNMFLTPILLGLQFVAQSGEMWRQHRNPEALSLRFLGLQVAVMAILAWRWHLRLCTAPQEPGMMSLAYPVVGEISELPIGKTTWGTCSINMLYIWLMPVVNYTASAVGYAALLVGYYFASHGAKSSEESMEESMEKSIKERIEKSIEKSMKD